MTPGNISSLKGIEYFTALKELYCCYNQLTSLDVSKNTALKTLECSNNQLTSLDVSKNIVMERLYCSGNQLTSLDVSKNMALTHLSCHLNQIKGDEMDKLISGLPNNTSDKKHYFVVVYRFGENGNVCTTMQVEAVKNKGWTPYDSNWNIYAGSDPSGINGVMMDTDINAPVFDLRGQRLKEPQKGINIIGGKKVVVK